MADKEQELLSRIEYRKYLNETAGLVYVKELLEAQVAKLKAMGYVKWDREKVAREIYAIFGAGECGCGWNELPIKIPEENAQAYYRQYADQLKGILTGGN